MKSLKIFIATILLAGIVALAVPGRGVYATPKKPSDQQTTTESSDPKDDDQDGETLDDKDIKDIDDISVKMKDGKLNTTFDDQSGNSTKTWNTIFKKYRIAIVGISGVLTLTFIVLFLINFFKVGAASDNPTERRKALIGVLWTGLAAAGSGSVTLICSLFWNALK